MIIFAIQFLDTFPAKTHTIQRARREILHQYVTGFDQPLQHFLAAFRSLVFSVNERLL